MLSVKALSSWFRIIWVETIICHSKQNEKVAMVAHRILISLSKKNIHILMQDVYGCCSQNDNI